jgi:hypothetical protein
LVDSVQAEDAEPSLFVGRRESLDDIREFARAAKRAPWNRKGVAGYNRDLPILMTAHARERIATSHI